MKNLALIALLGVGLTACDKNTEAPSAEAPSETAAQAAVEPAAAVEEKKEIAPVATIGQAAPDFELKDEAGKTHKLSDYKGKVVVLEWTSPECPYVMRHYEKNTMATTFKALGEDKIVWLAIDSSNFVKPEDAAKWKAEKGFTYPGLQDAAGFIGKIYQAKTTPHMFVVDAAGVLRYSGAIDNDPKGKEENPENYVEKAVTSLLAGGEVETSQTKPYGCSVKYGS